MQCYSHSFTHPGHLRMNNEDSYYSDDASGLWIVCDGMGGHQEGNFASRLVTDIFEKIKLKGNIDNKIEAITVQFHHIHRILKKKSFELGDNAIVGTTLVLLLIDGKDAAIIHSGDSRCYLHRGNELSIITKDHAKTVIGEHGEHKVLTCAISAPVNFSLEVKKFKIELNDIFLLCSDGLYDNLFLDNIKESLEIEVLEESMESMSCKVLSGDANDNLTATLVKVMCL